MSPSTDRVLTRTVRALAGLVLGTASSAADLLLVSAAAPFVAAARTRSQPVTPPVARALSAAAAWEHRRLAVFYGGAGPVTITPERAFAYLAQRSGAGLLGGVVLVLIVYGAVAGVALVVGWFTGDHFDGIPPRPWLIAYTGIFGAILLFVAVWGLVGAIALERGIARRRLGPSPLEAYEERIAALSASRAEVVAAVDEERRRIERDLHDGVQQRLVALGMLIGRARRADGDPALLAQAHEEARSSLAELREVSWRVYPAALDDAGLRAALDTVVERSILPVTLSCTVAEPPRAAAVAAYFVVCEAVTNAAKHSGATRVRVDVRSDGGRITVRIEDDGNGGADPFGGGLAGLARRVAALDGAFAVRSPAGGPTVVEADLPCG